MFSRKKVPNELPSLAVDDMNSGIKKPISQPQTNHPHKNSVPTKVVQPHNTLPHLPIQNHEAKAHPLNPSEDEAGYFRELVKSVTEETGDLDKLDTWYKNKFLPQDMVFQMREYWEKQQPDILLKNINGELKNKLMDKTGKLHTMEKEWQNIYFTLLAKEEEIRKEEKELKESLSEFISVFKNSLKRHKS